jgi:hypothetical protein
MAGLWQGDPQIAEQFQVYFDWVVEYSQNKPVAIPFHWNGSIVHPLSSLIDKEQSKETWSSCVLVECL